MKPGFKFSQSGSLRDVASQQVSGFFLIRFNEIASSVFPRERNLASAGNLPVDILPIIIAGYMLNDNRKTVGPLGMEAPWIGFVNF
jgi:hypothetical protein